MPHYVSKGLARFAPGLALKDSPSPTAYIAPNYGAEVQFETDDNSPLAIPDEKVWVQQVNGYFLYYARVQKSLMHPACNDISATQANPTANTVKAAWRLLIYLSNHPDHTVMYTACEMILKVYSDASYNSRPGSISIAGGWHYCGNSLTIPSMVPYIASAVVSLPSVVLFPKPNTLPFSYINGTAAAWEHTVLASLGYPQHPIVLITDNECAAGIANNKLTACKSKKIAMRYHWIRCRIRLDEFQCKWLPGKLNYADFFTKNLPVFEFEQYESIY